MAFSPTDRKASGALDVGEGNSPGGLGIENIIDVVQEGVNAVKLKIKQIQDNQESISIGDMFEMQMIMNNLAQLSEMSTNVVSSMHSAIQSMARNVKS